MRGEKEGRKRRSGVDASPDHERCTAKLGEKLRSYLQMDSVIDVGS